MAVMMLLEEFATGSAWPGRIQNVVSPAYYFICFCEDSERFINLRSLPTGAFETVEWSKFIPDLRNEE